MYNLISFVSRGKVRKQVLKELKEPHTPTELSRILKIHRSTISRTLLALQKKDIVKCITPKEKMGRYYDITKVGHSVLSKIKEISEEQK